MTETREQYSITGAELLEQLQTIAELNPDWLDCDVIFWKGDDGYNIDRFTVERCVLQFEDVASDEVELSEETFIGLYAAGTDPDPNNRPLWATEADAYEEAHHE